MLWSKSTLFTDPSTTTTTTTTTTTVASTTSTTASTSASSETSFTEYVYEYPEYSVSEAELHAEEESASEFYEEGAFAKDLETKEESFDKEMNLYEDVEDAVEESYEDEGDAVEESYEDSEASYGQSDESYGDEEGSYEDYEGFYDDQEELFGADEDDVYAEEDSSESQMRFSESEVRSKIGKKEDESDSVAGVELENKGLASGKKFSDLNGLTDLTSENKNEGIVKQQDSDPNSISRGKIASKDDFQESKAGSKDKYKHLDNLNAVHSDDVQKKKGLAAENEENAKWSSADESLGAEANWGADKKIKDNTDQEVFLGKYTQVTK